MERVRGACGVERQKLLEVFMQLRRRDFVAGLEVGVRFTSPPMGTEETRANYERAIEAAWQEWLERSAEVKVEGRRTLSVPIGSGHDHEP